MTSQQRGENLLKNQKIADMPKHISAVQSLIQACINVELFTIPLYMVSLYSITGMHEINSKSALYKGRIWPGSGPVTKPGESPKAKSDNAPGTENRKANEQAYNTIYSVFIDEMLHLQLVSNLASTIGVAPNFTSELLQNETSGWTCYGDDQTIIPHILDLEDTIDYKNVKVKLGPVDYNQLQLFLAIEQPTDRAEFETSIRYHKQYSQITENRRDAYFPKVPFAEWTVDLDESDLPMFGSIGYMYQCLEEYLSIEYADSHVDGHKFTLWEQLYNPLAQQRDLFNKEKSGHPYKEYPGFDAKLGVYDKKNARQNAKKSLCKANEMIKAITDQGEGSVPDSGIHKMAIIIEILIRALGPYEKLKLVNTFDKGHYTSHRSKGFDFNKAFRGLVKSIKPEAKKGDYAKLADTALMDVFKAALTNDLGEGYASVEGLIYDVENNVKRKYRPDKLALEKDYTSYNASGDEAYNQSSHAAARCGEFAGDITHYERFGEIKNSRDCISTWETWHRDSGSWSESDLVTSEYDAENPVENIPLPADVADALNNLKSQDQEQNCEQGDNFKLFSEAACGSIAGITRVLDNYWNNTDIDFPFPSMAGSGDRVSICWAVFGKAPDLSIGIQEVVSSKMYHACQGLSFTGDAPDNCASQQIYHSCKGSNQCKGQGGCGFVHSTTAGGNCGSSGSTADELYTAPGNNFCGNPNGGYGGCAVPISASQLYPNSGEMQVNKFTGEGCDFTALDETLPFTEGEAVYNVAWEAYCRALKAADPLSEPPTELAVSDLRLAFPPST